MAGDCYRRLTRGIATRADLTDSFVAYALLIKIWTRTKTATPKERKMAYHLFCDRPMKIPPEQLRYVLKEDMLTNSAISCRI